MSYFPLYIKTKGGDRALIAGGGDIAFRKIKVLVSFGIAMDVISMEFDKKIVGLSEINPSISLIKKDCFEYGIPSDSPYFFAVAATDDRDVNHQFACNCRLKHIPVNVVDDAAESDCIFPSVLKRGECVCTVSSGGICPPVTQYYRDKIADVVPEDIDRIIEEFGTLREELKEKIRFLS